MKIVMKETPPGSSFKAGQALDLDSEKLTLLEKSGHTYVSAREHALEQEVVQAQEAAKLQREASVDNAIKASKAFAPKQDTSSYRKTALAIEASEPGSGVAYIQSLPELAPVKAERTTSSEDLETSRSERIKGGAIGFKETIRAFFVANEPFSKTVTKGGLMAKANKNANAIEEAVTASKQKAIHLESLTDMIKGGANCTFNEDLIKAADINAYVDPAGSNPLGVLNTALTLQWNFGHLENQLVMLNDIVTDISNTPVLFNQKARTRYIQIPKGMLKTSTNAWPVSGAPTGTDVDVDVTMDTHFGVPISITNNIIGATARQLLNEQKTPQLYSVGQYIIYKLVNVICNGNTRTANDGTTQATINFAPSGAGATTFNAAGATLKTFTSDLPAFMDLSMFPGGDESDDAADLLRFAWVHTTLYAAATADTNFVLNQSIQGIRGQSSNGNVLETGRFNRLGNVKFRKSQLMTDTCAASGSGADATTNGISVSAGTYANATTLGVCGTRNALLWVSRVPQDYTKIMPEVPSTAAVELATMPKLGVTFMIVKHLDHAYESANMRAQIMFGQAIGDERQGARIVVK